jgi:hypothetical protein
MREVGCVCARAWLRHIVRLASVTGFEVNPNWLILAPLLLVVNNNTSIYKGKSMTASLSVAG